MKRIFASVSAAMVALVVMGCGTGMENGAASGQGDGDYDIVIMPDGSIEYVNPVKNNSEGFPSVGGESPYALNVGLTCGCTDGDSNTCAVHANGCGGGCFLRDRRTGALSFISHCVLGKASRDGKAFLTVVQRCDGGDCVQIE